MTSLKKESTIANSVEAKNVNTHKLSIRQIKSLEILKMTSAELVETVKSCVDENPFILGDAEVERGEDVLKKSDIFNIIDEVKKNTDILSPSHMSQLEKLKNYLDFQYKSDKKIVNIQSDYDNYIKSGIDSSKYDRDRENTVEDIIFQLNASGGDKRIVYGAVRLAERLDGYGFLRIDETVLCMFDDKNHFQESLQLLQRQEPSGIGALDPAEYIILKCRHAVKKLSKKGDEEKNTDAFEALAREYVIDPSHKNLNSSAKNISKKLEVSEELMRIMVSLVTEVKPQRITYDTNGDAEYITPDFIVDTDLETGSIEGRLTSVSAPSLYVNADYIKMLLGNYDDKMTDDDKIRLRSFVENQIDKSVKIFNMLNERRDTMMRFIDELASSQRDYFFYGTYHIKEMRQVDFASKIGVHQSTLSRLISGKYVSSVQGTVEVSRFFSQARSNKLIELMKRIIAENESGGDRTLSDRTIAQMMNDRGFKLSRRTVAKYRKTASIDNSYDRRNR